MDVSTEQRRLLKLKVGLMRCRAEALYELSSFERSLIFFYRCARARPDMAVEFRKGLKKAKNAICEWRLACSEFIRERYIQIVGFFPL